jgi:serine/threonine protein kinase
MEIKDIENLLENTRYEQFIGHFKPIELNNFVYKNLFKIGNDKLGYYSLKIRENSEKQIIDTINCLSVLHDNEEFVNRIIDIIEKDNHLFIISEWLNGVQPINIDNRKLLPSFFEKLAYFNKQNIADGPYTSMYADGNYFETIDKLIDWEINYHKRYLQAFMETNEITKYLMNLKSGLSCIILEDFNPGNLLLTNNGKYKYIDTEWIMRSLNLYQFEKIDYFAFEEEAWYKITENAEECYRAYFTTLGIKDDEANEQIRAYELLSALRKNTYLKYINKEDDKEIERRIKTIIEQNKFI